MVTLESIGNCPNCGAHIRGDECLYCGTTFTTKHEGIPIYDTHSTHITTLLLNEYSFTPNEARRLMGLPPITAPVTPNDIRAFQKANGIIVDGIIGPQTRARIEYWDSRKKHFL